MQQNRLRKQDRIEIRIDETSKHLLEKAALLFGESLSSYLIRNSLFAAMNDISKYETLQLSEEDKTIFYQLIANPPEPNDKLKKLFQGN